MFRNPKLIVLVLASGVMLSGFWGCLHTTAFHVTDIIQTLGALNLI